MISQAVFSSIFHSHKILNLHSFALFSRYSGPSIPKCSYPSKSERPTVRDLRIHGFWYLLEVLEPIPRGYPGTADTQGRLYGNGEQRKGHDMRFVTRVLNPTFTTYLTMRRLPVYGRQGCCENQMSENRRNVCDMVE